MKQLKKIEEAKKLYQTANADQRYVLERLFPELQESEDERIRKALLEYFGEECDTATINGIYCYKIYNWLEKQGETSPVLSNSLNTGKREIRGNEGKISPKWSKEDEEEFKIAIETLHEAGQHSSAMWLKSIKQRME